LFNNLATAVDMGLFVEAMPHIEIVRQPPKALAAPMTHRDNFWFEWDVIARSAPGHLRFSVSVCLNDHYSDIDVSLAGLDAGNHLAKLLRP
jgi:hypothetical protein